MEPYLPALAGGALIGAASVLLYATLGRIAGISGIAFGAVLPAMTGRLWRYAFLPAMLAGAWISSRLARLGARRHCSIPSRYATTLEPSARSS